MQHIARKRILLTRAPDDNRPWVDRLHSLGAEPIPFPCIRIEEQSLPANWQAHLDDSHWIVFTSRRAVILFASQLQHRTLAAHQIAAVGPTTRAACIDRFGRCELNAPQGTAASLAAALLPKLVPSAGVLLPGAADPRPELAQAISAAGARPLALPLYATHPTTTISTPTDFSRAHLDAILYASPTAVQGAANTASIPSDIPAACIGPTTATAARAAGHTNTTTAATRDLDGLLRSLEDLLTTTPKTR